MNATSEATGTAVSSFAYFGEEAPADPPGDARRSEGAADSFEACDALVDDLLDDDRGRHFGALARLREDRQRRATTNVEETTGRGLFATGHARLSERVRDVRDLRDARDAREREPFEGASRFTREERAPARWTSDDIGLVSSASLFPEEARETTGQKISSESAPASPYVPRRATDATPHPSPSPATPLDWSKTPPWHPRGATAAAPVAGSNPRAHGAASRAFVNSCAARKDNAPASPSLSPLSSPGSAAGDCYVAPRVSPAAALVSMSPTANGQPCRGYEHGYEHGYETRRAHSLDLGVSRENLSSRWPAGATRDAASRSFPPRVFSYATGSERPNASNAATDFSRVLGPAGYQDGYGGYHREPANALYKTELCRTWEETGSCRYGGKCQFAHGRDELRPVMRHPKYKTEVCRTFSTSGSCPYGTRCRFIHYRVPTRSVCGTLIAQAHNVIPTDWSPEMSSRDVGARGGCHTRFHGDWNAADVFPRDDDDTSPSAREDGFRRAASPLDGRRLPVFRDLAALSAERREESAVNDERIAGAARTSSSAGVSGDFSAEPFPFAFVAERRASASAAASAVRRAPPPCASGPYDIGASVLFGNV